MWQRFLERIEYRRMVRQRDWQTPLAAILVLATAVLWIALVCVRAAE